MTSLRARFLGKDGPEITRIGFGSWAIGGGGWAFGWGPQDDEASLAAMRHAVGRGINWIDTAAVYGLGHSEDLVGRLLREIPSGERPYVFTKCGLVWDEKDRTGEIRRTLSPASIRRECEGSLRRLGVEAIDLYQFHWPDPADTPVEESWAEMGRLADEGKVRWIGVSNFDVPLLTRCEAIRHVDSLQPPFSMIHRGVAAAEIPWCMAHGTGVIVYSPMASGLLTEKWTADRAAALPADDWRRGFPDFGPPDVTRNLALRDALRPIASRRGMTIGEVAVAWTLAWPGVTGAIVGARSPEQVDGWIGAGIRDLAREDMEELARAIRRTGAGEGPKHPSDQAGPGRKAG